MPRTPLNRSLLIGSLSLSLSLAVGCQSPSPVVSTSTGTPSGSQAASQPASILAGVNGTADINGVPFANAELKVFRPGETEPFATGQTGTDGRFSLTLGNVIAPGGGNVIAAGGGNVIAAGGGNVIAAGGGNVIAPGGGNLLSVGAPLKIVASKDGASLAAIATAGVIAAGGGNVIAAGGGNVIASGGGNVIAPGGGNYHVFQTPASEVHMNAATTLAVIALGDRLDGALRAVGTKDGQVLTSALNAILEAYHKLAASVVEELAGASGAALLASVVQALDANGEGELPAEVEKQLVDSITDFKTVFTETANTLGAAINTAIAAGGEQPAAEGTGDLSFGGVEAEAVAAPTTGTTTTGEVGGVPAPEHHSNNSQPSPLPTDFSITLTGQLAPATSDPGAPAAPVRPMSKSPSAFSPIAGSSTTRFGMGLVGHANKLYMIGGHDGTGPLNLVTEFAPTNNGTVTTLGAASDPQTLATAVNYPAVAVADNVVYVAGGLTASSAVKTVQSLALGALGSATTFLTTGPQLTTARFQHSMSVATSASATRLYVVGGEGVGGTALNSVEQRTVLPTPGNWTSSGRPLLQARQGHVSVVTRNSAGNPAFLYVIGGRSGNVNLDSVERSAIGTGGTLGTFSKPKVSFKNKNGLTMTYDMALSDPTNNPTNDPANNVSHGRFGMSSVVIGPWLYVFGGLQANGGPNWLSSPWTERAAIDPATGELGPFLPHNAFFREPRGFYGIAFGFSAPGNPSAFTNSLPDEALTSNLTDVLMLGGTRNGTSGIAAEMPPKQNERAIWR